MHLMQLLAACLLCAIDIEKCNGPHRAKQAKKSAHTTWSGPGVPMFGIGHTA